MTLGPIRVLTVWVALLAGGLAWMCFDEQGQPRNVAWVAPAARLPAINLPSVIIRSAVSDSSAYNSVTERPLFAPDRRPPPPPAPPAPPPPPDPLADVRIHGIFSGEPGGVLARIDGKVRRVKLNDKVGSWTLSSIDGRNVTFSQGNESRKLILAYAPLGVAAVPKATPQPLVGGAGPAAGTVIQRAQEETRDRVQRMNEERIKLGLPPLNYR